MSSLLGAIAEYKSNHAQKWGQICCKSDQLVRGSSFRNDLLHNPYFSELSFFSNLWILDFSFWRMQLIDAKSLDMVQPKWLSSCHFSAKKCIFRGRTKKNSGIFPISKQCFPSISYYFHIHIFLFFFLTLEKIGIDEKVICYHNISN